MKDQTSEGSIENELIVDLLKNSTLEKYRCKTKFLRGFIENVLSVDL